MAHQSISNMYGRSERRKQHAQAAGYDANAAPDLTEAVRAITEGVLSVAAGVSSESADGVTISYASSASSIANALVGSGAYDTMLAPYKVVNAHAT